MMFYDFSMSRFVGFACYANHVIISMLTLSLRAMVAGMDDIVVRACSAFPTSGAAYALGYSRMHPFDLFPLVVSGAPFLLYLNKAAFRICRSGVKACVRNLESLTSICVFLLICRWWSCYQETAAYEAIQRSEYLEVLSSIMEEPEQYVWNGLESRINRVQEESEKKFIACLPQPLYLFVGLFLTVEFAVVRVAFRLAEFKDF